MQDTELVRYITRMPMRTTRWQDIDDIDSNAARTLQRLAHTGAITRIAKGVYTVPPDGADGRRWRVPVEAGALALATVRYGERQAILMGVSAARHWGAIPRALGRAQVAVTGGARPPGHLLGGAVIAFIDRDFTRLDAVVEQTELGAALVTSPAQTFYDLLARTRYGDDDAAEEAVLNLAHRVTPEEIADIAARHSRVAPKIREFIRTGTL